MNVRRVLFVAVLALLAFPGIVAAPVTAGASGFPTAGVAPLSVTFLGNTTGGTAPFNYTWFFQDGTFAYTLNATHTFTYGGLFSVRFQVRDNVGSFSNATVDVRVVHPVELLLGFLLFASLLALSVAVHRVFLIVAGIAFSFLGFAVVLATSYSATWALVIPVFGGIVLAILGAYNIFLKASTRKKGT